MMAITKTKRGIFMNKSKKEMSRDEILAQMGINPNDVRKASNKGNATLSTKGKVRNEIKEGMEEAINNCKYNKLIRTTTLKASNDANKQSVKDFEGRFIVIEDKAKGEYEVIVPKLYFETYKTPYVNFLDETK